MFVPFLTNHYETVYVVDFRYYRGNLQDLLPASVSVDIREVVCQKYPKAIILDIDRENGKIEVDILDRFTKKEVIFNMNNIWISTTWELRRSSVPDSILQVLRTSTYGNYRVDEIFYREQATNRNTYMFEVEKNDHEVNIMIDAASMKIISITEKD